jgi:sugar/nucleoside kinase (ribokinase family)
VVYLYGMTVWTTAHRLASAYPEADTYGEIVETFQFPGGETGNSALVLSRFGHQTKIDGPFLGSRTEGPIRDFYLRNGVDCSLLHFDPDFEGLEDLVLIGEGSRTVFGRFGHYFSGPKRWSEPDEESISQAELVTIDPFFREESLLAAELCVRHGRPYVTIDCEPDSFLHRHAEATVVSGEFLRSRSHDVPDYTGSGNGLVVFTSGSGEIRFGRKGRKGGCIEPFRVEVKSTLGAGDTFRAGIAHGLIAGMSDLDTVRFAAATAACFCRRFPMAFDPPKLQEVELLCRSAN